LAFIAEERRVLQQLYLNFTTKCAYTVEYLYRLLNITYMFRRSLLHPHSYHFSKPSAVTVFELQSVECIICGIFTELLTIIKIILARCYGLIFLKI